MKKIVILMFLFINQGVYGQGKWGKKFEQLGTTLPTPNTYRTASGAPGIDYWQQKADYNIKILLDDEKQSIIGSEQIIINIIIQTPNVCISIFNQLKNASKC